ncbi:Ap4A phosphorylase-like protein II [Pleomassaria siparia CBS 279.74]|uniref:Ap4A phosphorylase-like protein II n=1 Tax=Pleomassaria siparia CBS 279.74 TaxID=1314801 RepID=A0A6G1KB09_9PLEO|nr:Ap4A phosphorylase-like protein II [Pleomassaria siparia CBS 279.74]
MPLDLSESLPHLVEAKYKTAKADQSLTFSPTELAIVRTSAGVPFQLRFCPSLAKKPIPQKENHDGPTKKKRDPFDNPSAELLIADIPSTNPSHLLVLNKFPVIAEHFILATKTNKQQTHILEQDDLEATYACLEAWQAGEAHGQQRRLFAFFNSGEHSGASQPHRHLQFLPVESMKKGEHSNEWDLLLDSMLSGENPALPFTHFASALPPNPSGSKLLETYNNLYDLARKAVDDFISTNPDEFLLHPTDKGALSISYNLAMTTSGMAICPRKSEGTMLRRDDGTEIGFVALNGTVLGGTLMVKYQEEWDVLRSQPEKLDSILGAIGIPKTKQTSSL